MKVLWRPHLSGGNHHPAGGSFLGNNSQKRRRGLSGGWKSHVFPDQWGWGSACKNHSQVLLGPNPSSVCGTLEDTGEHRGENKGAVCCSPRSRLKSLSSQGHFTSEQAGGGGHNSLGTVWATGA